MGKIRIVIIDDEAPAREIIKHYLKEVDNIEVIAECSDGFSGLKSISSLKPDLVFLDIQMPRLTGIELVEVLTEKPKIIFTTAYDQFAIKAFELNAVDYLMNCRLFTTDGRALFSGKFTILGRWPGCAESPGDPGQPGHGAG